jgi:hypothetical protein
VFFYDLPLIAFCIKQLPSEKGVCRLSHYVISKRSDEDVLLDVNLI